MPPLLRQPHREFYALVPLLLLLEPIGGDEALQGLHAHLHGGGGVLAHVLIQTGGLPLLIPDHIYLLLMKHRSFLMYTLWFLYV